MCAAITFFFSTAATAAIEPLRLSSSLPWPRRRRRQWLPPRRPSSNESLPVKPFSHRTSRAKPKSKTGAGTCAMTWMAIMFAMNMPYALTSSASPWMVSTWLTRPFQLSVVTGLNEGFPAAPHMMPKTSRQRHSCVTESASAQAKHLLPLRPGGCAPCARAAAAGVAARTTTAPPPPQPCPATSASLIASPGYYGGASFDFGTNLKVL